MGDEEDTGAIRLILGRILRAFVKRNRHHGGYTQGMNMMCRVLLAFQPEAHVFWMYEISASASASAFYVFSFFSFLSFFASHLGDWVFCV